MNRDELSFLKENGYYPFPQTIQIEITKVCPFSCKQCYKPKSNSEHMDYKKLNDFLEYINEKCPVISLNGGEPLIYPHFYDLLNKIKKMNFNTYVYSSGYGIERYLCREIDDNRNLHFSLSLNGSTAEINDKSREGYSYTIDAIELMTEENVDFHLAWVARHDNVDDFINIINLAAYYNIPYISIISNRLTGNGRIDSQLTREDLNKLAEIISNKSVRKPYILIDNCFPLLLVELKNFVKGLPMRCAAGISRCNVNYNFSFQPCTHLNYPETYSSIDEYWKNSEILHKIREHDFKQGGLCQNCMYKRKCDPCRASCIETYNNLDAYISECIKFKVIGV